MSEVTVAVADLARFCHRSGDIDHRFSPSPTGEQGVAGHQQLYRTRPSGYISEFPVEHTHLEGELQVKLRGRADGYHPGLGYVEEIKTCRVDPGVIPEAVSRSHLAQAKLYAALIAIQEALEEIDVRLTWFNIDTQQEISLEERWSQAELGDFLQASLGKFSRWLRRLAELQEARNANLARLAFPYGEFRRGQRELAELTYKCIDQGGQLMLEAPTGIGKSAAVLYPALKALATGKHDRVVFVTSRTVGRRAAEDTLALFADSAYCGTAISLTARDSICLSPGSACHGDECPFARGYYDKLPVAMSAALGRPLLRRQEIESIAREHEVCPYQLALDLMPWMDVVIADIHYVYSLTAAVGAMLDSQQQRWTILLDEAHNLPARARGMFGAVLAKSAVMAARLQADVAVRRSLDKVNRQLLALQREDWLEEDFDSREEQPHSLLTALQSFIAVIAERLAAEPAYLQHRAELMDFYFDVLKFLRVADYWGADFRLELSRDGGRQSLRVTQNCLDPARLLAHGHARAHALAAFSATLSPRDWSRASLGLSDQAVCHRARSPFSPDQLQVSIAVDIDTRYRQRESSLPALARTLVAWLAEVPGNCIVYFPAYRYLRDCMDLIARTDLEALQRRVWMQQPGLDEAARDALLQELAQRRDMAAFCILGGVFGEGVDLPGEQLASIVVVGVGMPQVNRQTRQLQDWYQQRYGSGFEYAFVYPGMQKVDQALGRVVRRIQDRGRALLIDPRYGQQRYRQLLPPWWDYRPWVDGMACAEASLGKR
jgi:DNA excision repair protein ERCC-2